METIFGKFGCCLACDECGKCYTPCSNCKCSKCDWYHKGSLQYIKQRCYYLDFKKEFIIFDYLKIISSTEKAYLISDGEIQAWIPSKFVRFEEHDISIVNWIADEKGFFDEGILELEGMHFKDFEKKYLPKTKYHCRNDYNY